MERIKEFIKKYKIEIITILAAISAILVNINSERPNVWANIAVILIAVMVEAIKNGVTEVTIKLLTELALIIIDELSPIDNKENNVVLGSANTSQAIQKKNINKDTKKRKSKEEKKLEIEVKLRESLFK